MTFLETLHTKSVANELNFPLVTHTTHFDKQFGRYGILKLYYSSGHDLKRLDCRWSVRFLRCKMVRLARVRIQLLKDIKSAFQCLLKHTFSITVTTVTAI
jgi:hypothetical protein